MKQVKLIIIAILAVLPVGSFAQTTKHLKLSTKTQNIIDSLSSYEYVYSDKVGRAGRMPSSFGLLIKLKKSPAKQLRALCNHEDEVLRCYAFWALCLKKDKQRGAILQQHAADTAEVDFRSGCTGSKLTVNELFTHIYKRTAEHPFSCYRKRYKYQINSNTKADQRQRMICTKYHH